MHWPLKAPPALLSTLRGRSWPELNRMNLLKKVLPLAIRSITLARLDRQQCLARSGEVSERLKEHAWKVCIREIVSRVRIPSSPPLSNQPKTPKAERSSGFLGSSTPQSATQNTYKRHCPRRAPLPGRGADRVVGLRSGCGDSMCNHFIFLIRLPIGSAAVGHAA